MLDVYLSSFALASCESDSAIHLIAVCCGPMVEHGIGSGTYLDSARLRGAIAAKAGVAASSIDAYVLGEHGESQVVWQP